MTYSKIDLLIIGGAPRCGKSTIAREMAQQKQMSHLALDALVEALEKTHPQLGIRHLGGNDWQVASAVEPILLEQLRWMHGQKMRVIVDAYHLKPQTILKLQEQIPLRAVFLGYPRSSLEQRFQTIRQNEKGTDWTRNFDDATLLKHIESFIENSVLLSNWCKECQIPFIDVSDNLGEGIREARKVLSPY